MHRLYALIALLGISISNTPIPTGAKEVLHGGATSPIACTAANTVILDARSDTNIRHTAWIQNVGTVDLFICFNDTTCAADGSVYDKVLKAASGANKDDGGGMQLGPQPSIWNGGITCGGGVGGKLAVFAY